MKTPTPPKRADNNGQAADGRTTAALGRLRMAADALSRAAHDAATTTGTEAGTGSADDGDEDMSALLASIRRLISGEKPPPETPENAAEREAEAVRRTAAAMEDGHLAAFIRWSLSAATHSAAADLKTAGSTAFRSPPTDPATLLRLTPATRRHALLKLLARADADAAEALQARAAALTRVPLSALTGLNAALSAFHDGTVHRPAADDLARIARLRPVRPPAPDQPPPARRA